MEKLKEFLKLIQTNSTEFRASQLGVFETVKKISNNLNENDIKHFFDKFADIGTVLNNNITKFVRGLNSFLYVRFH